MEKEHQLHSDNVNLNISYNKICFCRKPLKRYEYRWTQEWRCHCCFRTYPKNISVYYDCGDNECKYYNIYGAGYTVCSSCFDTFCDWSKESPENKLDDENEGDFVSNKIESTLQIISLVFTYRNTINNKYNNNNW